MVNNSVINNLKKILESSTMITYLRSLPSDSERLRWLQKAMYFLMSTRDYDQVFLYLLNNDDLTFPVSYMEKKNLLEKDIQAIFKDNYLKNGFLYHGTSNIHERSIIDKGLVGLTLRYGQEFVTDLEKINVLCQSIALNTLKYTQGKIMLKEELPLDFLAGKTNSVYLTADISQAYDYSNNNNNWFREFVKNLIDFIGGEFVMLYFEDKTTLFKQVLSALNSSKAIISENEKQTLIKFIEKYYNMYELSDKPSTKSLVIVKNNIELNESFANLLAQSNDKMCGINYVLKQLNSQEIYSSKVDQKDLAVLSFNSDQSLSLKLGKGGN